LILLSEDKHQHAMVRADNSESDKIGIQVQAPKSQQKMTSLKRPYSFPKKLPSLLGIGLVLFLVGLLLPFVNLDQNSTGTDHVAEDQIAELLLETDPLKEQAKSLLEQGKFKEAIAMLDGLCSRFPQDPEALILKNNAYALFSNLKTYHIPVLSSWHGSEREGLQLLYGFALAQSQLNRLRIGKKPLIVLDLYDDRSNNEALLNITSEVAANPNVPLLLGPYTSQQTRLIAPLANSKGLPVLAPVASDPQVFSTGRFIFSASDTDTKKIKALASYLYKSGGRRAAIFSNSSSVISRSWSDAFVESFQKDGGLIALTDEYPNNQVDFRNQIQEARDQGADCIFLAEFRLQPVVNFCESLRATDWDPLLSANIAVFSDGLFRRGQKVVEGLLATTYYIPEEGGQDSKSFNREFRQVFDGRRPTHREVNSFDTLILAVTALDTVGPDREKLRAYFTDIGNERPSYKGVSGEFALDHALGARTAYILRVEQGTYKLVDRETFNEQ